MELNVRTTQSVLDQLGITLNEIHLHLQSLAPINSKYTGLYNFKKCDFIFVNNKRVYTNTGNLRNSVRTKETMKGTTLVHDVYVSSASVPYYQKAVLNETITRARHYGRLEYGSVRYTSTERWKHSLEEEVYNRNYMYYLKGEDFVKSQIGKYNNQRIYVNDDIGRWQNGI